MLAGLRVGGLAVALAARDSLANLLGSIMMMIEKPFRVGHYVKVSRGEGTVGDVSFRSTWIRTPGARNPQQRIEIVEPFQYGEIITTTVTTADKFTQRGKPYLQMLLDFRNEKGELKARWWCSLILPATRADVARFANA